MQSLIRSKTLDLFELVLQSLAQQVFFMPEGLSVIDTKNLLMLARCNEKAYTVSRLSPSGAVPKESVGLVESRSPGRMVKFHSIEKAEEATEARVMRLKGYGNAIVPQLAAEFIKAFFGNS